MTTSHSTELPDPPVEEVSFTRWQSMGQSCVSAIAISTILSAMIAALCGLLSLSWVLAGKTPVSDLAIVPLFAIAMFCGSLCFFLILTVPGEFYFTLRRRSRVFRAEGDQLHVEIGRKRQTIDLKRCSWQRCGTLTSACGGYYFGTQPRVSLWLDEEVFLGFTEDAASKWIEYFRAIQVDEKIPRFPWPRFLVFSTVALTLGGAIGTVVERSLSAPPNPQGALVFLGFLDGFAVMLAYWFRGPKYVGPTRLSCMAFWAMIFAVLGLMTGGFSWQVICANSLLGAVAGWLARPAKLPQRSS